MTYTEADRPALAVRLRALRKQYKLTLTDVAAYLEVDISHLSRIERGQRPTELWVARHRRELEALYGGTW